MREYHWLRKGLHFLLSLSCILLLTGCWDHVELTERGFVMGVAIDTDEDEKIVLTAQIYRPTQSAASMGGKQGDAYVNIRVVQDNIFEAVRDIPTHLGRKAQWSHQRVILISDEFAKKRNLQEVLDFLNHDHEPRQTSNVYITKGFAGDFLDKKPLIESTISQQLKRVQESTAENSGKMKNTLLLNLNLDIRSQTGIAEAPYIGLNNEQDKSFSFIGVAFLKGGKMVHNIDPASAEPYLMLLNEYHNGIIQVPCQSQDLPQETVEVVDMNTDMNINASEEEIDVQIDVHIKGSVSELYCSDLNTVTGEKVFIERMTKTVEEDIRSFVTHIQEKKLDVLGIGNHIYRVNPKLWKRIEPNWDDRFAQVRFTYNVSASIVDTGMYLGKPVEKK